MAPSVMIMMLLTVPSVMGTLRTDKIGAQFYWSEFSIILLTLGSVAFAGTLAIKYFSRSARWVDFPMFVLSCTDFATDVVVTTAYCTEWSSFETTLWGKYERFCYGGAIAISVRIVNLWVMRELVRREIMFEPEFKQWWKRHKRTVVSLFVVSAGNIDSLTLLNSGMFNLQNFKAPWSRKTMKRILFWSHFACLAEDVPLFVLWMFTIWDNVRTLTVLNLLVALATLIFGFMKRLWLRWSLRDDLVIQMRDPSLVQLVPHRRRRRQRQGHRRKPDPSRSDLPSSRGHVSDDDFEEMEDMSQFRNRQDGYHSVVPETMRLLDMSRKHVCDFCGKEFSQRGNLTHHIRVHTGDKPFSCPSCPHAAKTRSNLRKHILAKHSGTKSFVCDMCGYRSAIKSGLTRHQKLPHVHLCPVMGCRMTFPKMAQLKRHLPTAHGSIGGCGSGGGGGGAGAIMLDPTSAAAIPAAPLMSPSSSSLFAAAAAAAGMPKDNAVVSGTVMGGDMSADASSALFDGALRMQQAMGVNGSGSASADLSAAPLSMSALLSAVDGYSAAQHAELSATLSAIAASASASASAAPPVVSSSPSPDASASERDRAGSASIDPSLASASARVDSKRKPLASLLRSESRSSASPRNQARATAGRKRDRSNSSAASNAAKEPSEHDSDAAPPSESMRHRNARRQAVPVWDFLNAQSLLPRRSISAPANGLVPSVYEHSLRQASGPESSISLPQASISAPHQMLTGGGAAVHPSQPCPSPSSSNPQVEGSRSHTPTHSHDASASQALSRAEPSVSKSMSFSQSASHEAPNVERSITKSRTHANAYHPSLSPISSIGEDDEHRVQSHEHSHGMQRDVVMALLDSVGNGNAASAQQLAAVALRARLQAQEHSLSVATAAAAGGVLANGELSDAVNAVPSASLYNGRLVRRVLEDDADAHPRVAPVPVPKAVLEAERAAAAAVASSAAASAGVFKSAAPMPDEDSVNETSVFPAPSLNDKLNGGGNENQPVAGASAGGGSAAAAQQESVSPAQLVRLLEQRAIERKKALPPCLVCGVMLPSSDEFVEHMKMHHEEKMQHEEILEQMLDQPVGRRKFHPSLRSPFTNLQNGRYAQTQQALLHQVHPPGHAPHGRYRSPRGRPPNSWLSPAPPQSSLAHMANPPPRHHVYDYQEAHHRATRPNKRSSPVVYLPHSAPLRLQVGSSASSSTVDLAALGQPPPYSGTDSLSRNTNGFVPSQPNRPGAFANMFDSLDQNWSNVMSAATSTNGRAGGGESSPTASVDTYQADNRNTERDLGRSQSVRRSLSRYSSQPEGTKMVHLPPALSPRSTHSNGDGGSRTPSRSTSHHNGRGRTNSRSASASGDFQPFESTTDNGNGNGSMQRVTNVDVSPEVGRTMGNGSFARWTPSSSVDAPRGERPSKSEGSDSGGDDGTSDGSAIKEFDRSSFSRMPPHKHLPHVSPPSTSSTCSHMSSHSASSKRGRYHHRKTNTNGSNSSHLFPLPADESSVEGSRMSLTAMNGGGGGASGGGGGGVDSMPPEWSPSNGSMIIVAPRSTTSSASSTSTAPGRSGERVTAGAPGNMRKKRRGGSLPSPSSNSSSTHSSSSVSFFTSNGGGGNGSNGAVSASYIKGVSGGTLKPNGAHFARGSQAYFGPTRDGARMSPRSSPSYEYFGFSNPQPPTPHGTCSASSGAFQPPHTAAARRMSQQQQQQAPSSSATGLSTLRPPSSHHDFSSSLGGGGDAAGICDERDPMSSSRREKPSITLDSYRPQKKPRFTPQRDLGPLTLCDNTFSCPSSYSTSFGELPRSPSYMSAFHDTHVLGASLSLTAGSTDPLTSFVASPVPSGMVHPHNGGQRHSRPQNMVCGDTPGIVNTLSSPNVKAPASTTITHSLATQRNFDEPSCSRGSRGDSPDKQPAPVAEDFAVQETDPTSGVLGEDTQSMEVAAAHGQSGRRKSSLSLSGTSLALRAHMHAMPLLDGAAAEHEPGFGDELGDGALCAI